MNTPGDAANVPYVDVPEIFTPVAGSNTAADPHHYRRHQCL